LIPTELTVRWNFAVVKKEVKVLTEFCFLWSNVHQPGQRLGSFVNYRTQYNLSRGSKIYRHCSLSSALMERLFSLFVPKNFYFYPQKKIIWTCKCNITATEPSKWWLEILQSKTKPSVNCAWKYVCFIFNTVEVVCFYSFTSNMFSHLVTKKCSHFVHNPNQFALVEVSL